MSIVRKYQTLVFWGVQCLDPITKWLKKKNYSYTEKSEL